MDDLREIGLLDRALDLFLETSPREMQRLSDAIAEGRLRDAYLISHSLKGSSATLGAVQVAALCAALCAALSDEREARSAGVLVEALALSMLQTNALLAAQR